MINDIDNIFLPGTSPNEVQENLSRKKFALIFDEERFILAGVQIDNGVDFACEIKRNTDKLGYGFNFQLKSKAVAEKNSDGSYSKSLETSNIEYLLNKGQPAFYGFYLKDEDKFLYESLDAIIRSLELKSKDWEKQANHSVRFTKILDVKATDDIYSVALNNGNLLRGLNYRLAIKELTINASDKIVIDYDFNITDDSEIRIRIEKFGLALINQGRWSDVLKLYQNATGNINTTSKLNLIIGIANYHNGHHYEALSAFKKASALENELSEELKDHLKYFYSTLKCSLGIINKQEYENLVSYIEKDADLSLFVKIEQIKNEYINSTFEDYELFANRMYEIIYDQKANGNIKSIAKCELLFWEGSKNNMNYFREVSVLNGIEEIHGVNSDYRVAIAQKYIAEFNNWLIKSHELRKETYDNKNYFAYQNTRLNEIKVKYEKRVYEKATKVTKPTPGHDNIIEPDDSPYFQRMIDELDELIEFYGNIEYVNNLCVSLSTKYEILHFKERYGEAETIKSELKNIILKYGLDEHKNKYEFLIAEGTTHEQLNSMMNETFKQKEKEQIERTTLVSEMEEMDKSEREKIGIGFQLPTHRNILTLFPIGDFQFPTEKMNLVFEILRIPKPEIKEQFQNMFELNVIPIANVFYETIEHEGYGDGNLASNGIVSWRNIHRIRKAFYENNFYRL